MRQEGGEEGSGRSREERGEEGGGGGGERVELFSHLSHFRFCPPSSDGIPPADCLLYDFLWPCLVSLVQSIRREVIMSLRLTGR